MCFIFSISGCIPTVLLVLEGGPGTLGTVYSAINNKIPVPCVIIGGSGRCADLLAYTMKNSEEIEKTMESADGIEHEGLMEVIKETFPEKPKEEDRKAIYEKLIKCVQKKESVRKCYSSCLLYSNYVGIFLPLI